MKLHGEINDPKRQANAFYGQQECWGLFNIELESVVKAIEVALTTMALKTKG
jgi:hypothetical protein